MTPHNDQTPHRFYVYTGPAVASWINYATAAEARAAHPGEMVFDRLTRQEAA
jgi:hypothetical protein